MGRLNNENILKLILSNFKLPKIKILNYETKNWTISKTLLKLLSYEAIYKSLGNTGNTSFGKQEKFISLFPINNDGNIIAYSEDFTLKTCDIKNNIIKPLDNCGQIYITSMLILPNNILLTCTTSALQLWDLKNECNLLKKIKLGNYRYLYNPILLDNGNIAISAINNFSYIVIVDCSKHEHNIVKELNENTYYAFSLVTLSNNKFASGNSKGLISIWDIADDYKCLKSFENHKCQQVSTLAFSEKENLLFSGFYNSTIKVFNMNDYVCVANFNTFQDSDAYIVLLPGGYFASVCKSVKIWNATNYHCVNTIEGNGSSFYSLLRLNDNRLVTCSDDKGIAIWDY
jgi:WD40 repeat protein